jgi:catechol 2,3-dioxygenase-like lactoylglutathione lyase family enzyme
MMITGVNHITLSVHNLKESVEFYQEVLGFKLAAIWDRGAYLLAGDLWLCLTLDTRTRTEALREYTHIALNTKPSDFESLCQQIINSGTVIWKENLSEGDSLYFLDPNGHKLEIHCNTLQDRLEACKKNPYSGMIFYE